MEMLKKIIEFVMDVLETIVFVGSLFIVLYLFILAPNKVKGASMLPTFADEDHILTSKISYKFGSPKRGDVIVFASLQNQDIDYIKRIIAIPEDRIMIKGNDTYVNGERINEKYISDKTTLFDNGFMKDGIEIVVPKGHLFVMGDNRPHSSDSREFGFVPSTNIIGKVIYRYYPPQKMGPVKNPYESMNLFYLSNKDAILVRR